MATRRTLEFLDGQKIKYAVIRHSPAHSAQEVAASAHIPGRSMAKTVVVQIDGRLALAVVRADKEVDMGLLRAVAGANFVMLANPSEFVDRFEGCKLGTEPPLGNLFGMDTFVDSDLSENEFVAFNAGSLTDVVVLKFSDYRRLAHPILAHISAGAGKQLKDLHTAQI